MSLIEINNIKENNDELNLYDFAATEDLVSSFELEKNSSEMFYLDEDDNYSSENLANKGVIRITDENGDLIQEVWSFKDSKTKGKNVESKVLYIDENENEVEEDLATHMIMKQYVDGKEVNSKKVPIYKDSNKIL